MLGFVPEDEVVFKVDGKEIELIAVFDSQDWNPNEKRQAVFDFSPKNKAESDAQ